MESVLKIIKSRGAVVISGLILSALLIIMTGLKIEWRQVQEAFNRAVWLPWLPLAAGTYAIGMLLRGWRLKQLVGKEATLTVATGSNIVAVGYAVNNILPARLGEFARAGMLAERTGLPYALSLTVTFLERLLDGLTILSLFVVASLVTPTEDWMRSASQVAALIFALVLPCVLVLAIFPQFSLSLASQITHPLGRKWHSKALALTTQVARGFSCLSDAGSALYVLSLSFLIWLVEALMFALVMPCFGMKVAPIKACAVMAFTNLGILIPSTPGYVGTYHTCCSQALQAVTSQSPQALLPFLPSNISALLLPGSINTVDMATALSYAVVVHLIFYATVTVWGVIAMARYGVELGSTATLAWQAKPATLSNLTSYGDFAVITSVPSLKTTQMPITNCRFWLKLSEAILPERAKGLSAEEHQTALANAAEFLCQELTCLPSQLKVLLKIGLFGFRSLCILSGFTLFEQQSLEHRRQVVDQWSYGPVAITRKLFKPLRAIALLSYFESAAVQAALDQSQGERENLSERESRSERESQGERESLSERESQSPESNKIENNKTESNRAESKRAESK